MTNKNIIRNNPFTRANTIAEEFVKYGSRDEMIEMWGSIENTKRVVRRAIIEIHRMKTGKSKLL